MMHGPNHLFCAGCDMDDDPLAAAAWAGNLSAIGRHADAEKWAQEARRRLGRMIVSFGTINVRVVGEGPTVEDVDATIETLKITRDGYERRADLKKKEEERKAAAADTACVSSGPETKRE